MFERFSDAARRVVVLAQEEARLLGHDFIGSEHLLVACTRTDAGHVSDVLVAHGLTPPEVRAAIGARVQRALPPSGHIPFTPEAKAVLEGSLRFALERDDTTLTPVHVVLALLDQPEGVTHDVIDELVDDRAALNAAVRGTDHVEVNVRGATLGNTVQTAVLSARGVVPGPPRPVVGPTCAFCGREESQVDRVVVARGTIVCAECIAGAADLLGRAADDPGAGSRIRFRRQGAEPDDPERARRAIERAFEAVFPGGAGERPDARWAVEDFPGRDDDLAALAEGSRNAPMVVNDMTVERVAFVDPGIADVSIGVWMAGSQQPMLLPGRAVLVDGAWKVSGATVSWFAQQARMFRRSGPFGP